MTRASRARQRQTSRRRASAIFGGRTWELLLNRESVPDFRDGCNCARLRALIQRLLHRVCGRGLVDAETDAAEEMAVTGRDVDAPLAGSGIALDRIAAIAAVTAAVDGIGHDRHRHPAFVSAVIKQPAGHDLHGEVLT